MSIGNTAILFFSRTQHDEFSAKSLGVNKNHFGSLYKFFTGKSLSTARNTGLPVIESYSDQQHGKTFSERLTNELQLVASQGFENVIIIGNDTPDLTCDDILLANDQLLEGKHVLGKDKRGGVYLIGLNLSDFDLSLFDQVRWNSSLVYDQLCKELAVVYELAPKIDINHLQDIRALLRQSGVLTRGTISFLRSFLSSVELIAINLNPVALRVIPLPTHRGPPATSY